MLFDHRSSFIFHPAFTLAVHRFERKIRVWQTTAKSKDLESALEQIWEVARGFGLDPFPTRFEIVPATVMYEIGSYALPGRYSHWTFGKAYHRMKTMYDFGLSKIYEVVINTNPSYGFLLETNCPVQNKLVIAHVLGHVDFFKHNAYFSKTNRRMVEIRLLARGPHERVRVQVRPQNRRRRFSTPCSPSKSTSTRTSSSKRPPCETEDAAGAPPNSPHSRPLRRPLEPRPSPEHAHAPRRSRRTPARRAPPRKRPPLLHHAQLAHPQPTGSAT